MNQNKKTKRQEAKTESGATALLVFYGEKMLIACDL
jgi:hypothetical protein